MAQTREKTTPVKTQKKFPLRLWIPLGILPVSLIVLFCILSSQKQAMDWAEKTISSRIRLFMEAVTSALPFSLAEALITVFFVWLLFFLFKTLFLLIKRKSGILHTCKRILILLLVVLYIAAGYLWLWEADNYAASFSERNGLSLDGITAEQLVSVTEAFAENANRLSNLVKRDENGHFSEDITQYFDSGKFLYDHISSLYPTLGGVTHRSKQMLYSKLMSTLGFTGFYFPFTGEANINVDSPSSLIPSTIAHEIAHQRGISSEQEANFVGILACVTSDMPVYQYSGYLSGLIYLMNALDNAAPEALSAIQNSFSDAVKRDISDNNMYWARFSSPAEEIAGGIYDSYLKASGQSLGIHSYGACVDLLVHYFS